MVFGLNFWNINKVSSFSSCDGMFFIFVAYSFLYSFMVQDHTPMGSLVTLNKALLSKVDAIMA